MLRIKPRSVPERFCWLLTFAGAELVSNVGSWIATMAIFQVIVFQSGGGIAESTGVFIAARLPGLFVAPFAGSMCDRFDRRGLLVFSRLLGAGAVFGLLIIEGVLSLYILVAIASVLTAIVSPVRQTIVRDVVPDEGLTRANAFLEQFASATKIFGPVLGGLIVARVSPQAAIGLYALALALSAVLLSFLPSLPAKTVRPSDEEGEGSLHARDVLRAYPEISRLLVLNFWLTFVVVATDVSVAVIVRDYLKAGIEFNGLLSGLVGFGMLAGTGVLMVVRQSRNAWRDTLSGYMAHAAAPLSLALAALLPSVQIARGVVILGYVFVGVGAAVAQVQGNTYLQRTVPGERLGSLQGILHSVMMSGQLAGLLVTPVLVPRVLSLPMYFMVTAALLVQLIVSAGMRLRGRRASAAESQR